MADRPGWMMIRGYWFMVMSWALLMSPPASASSGNITTGMVAGMPANVAIADMEMNPVTNQIILAGYRYVQKDNTGWTECVATPVIIVDVQQNKVVAGPDNETSCQGIAVAVSRDGAKAYVSVGNNVEVVNMKSSPNHVKGTVQGMDTGRCKPYASSIAFSPDGSKAYVAFDTSCDDAIPRIAVVDATNDTFLRWVTGLPSSVPGPAPGAPRLKFNPDPARQIAYVTYSVGALWGGGVLWALNTQTDAWQQAIAPTEQDALLGSLDFSLKGDKAFVADSHNCGIAIIDVATASPAGFTSIPFCAPSGGVSGVSTSPDGSTVYAFGNTSYAAPKVMNSDGKLIGAVENYDGANSTGGPIVFSGDSKTAYLSRMYHVDNSNRQSMQSWVTASDIAVVHVPGTPAQMQKVSPSTGVDLGGTRVSIRGAYLSGTTSVLFGAAAATDLNVVSDSAVRVTTPPNPVGPTDVTVVNPGGNATLKKGFTYTTGFKGNGPR